MCYIHGGSAKQVRQKQEQRLAVWDARVAAAAEPTVVMQREPEELLLDALHDTNAVLQQLKAELHGGSVNPILLQLAGEWLDRLGRLGKVITDGDLSRKLHERVGWLAQDRAQQMWGMLVATLKAAPLSAQDRLLVWNAVEAGLRAVLEEREPLRLSGDEVHRVTDRLMAEAAREETLAEGLPWGDDSDDDDVDSPALFSPVARNGNWE